MIAGLTMQNGVNGPWKSSVLSLQKQENSEDFVATKDKLAISWEGRNIIVVMVCWKGFRSVSEYLGTIVIRKRD